MGKFFTRHFFKSPNAFLSRSDLESDKKMQHKFNLGNAEVILYDHDDGIYADTYVFAEDIIKAENDAKLIVETLISLIDYTTSSSSSAGLLEIIYDATNKFVKREFKKVFYIPVEERSVSTIDQDFLKNILEGFFTEKLPPQIARSISFLRKAQLETDGINKFVFLWTGLEALNVLLMDQFGILEDQRVFICPDCGKKGAIISVGIEKIFTEHLGIKKGDFTKIRRNRGNFIHGGSLTTKFINEMKSHNPILREALISAIGLLLPLKEEQVKEMINQKTKKYNAEYRLIIKRSLINFTPPIIQSHKKQPDIIMINNSIKERTLDDNDKVNVKTSAEFNFIPKEVFGGDAVTEIIVDPDSSIESAKFNGGKATY